MATRPLLFSRHPIPLAIAKYTPYEPYTTYFDRPLQTTVFTTALIRLRRLKSAGVEVGSQRIVPATLTELVFAPNSVSASSDVRRDQLCSWTSPSLAFKEAKGWPLPECQKKRDMVFNVPGRLALQANPGAERQCKCDFSYLAFSSRTSEGRKTRALIWHNCENHLRRHSQISFFHLPIETIPLNRCLWDLVFYHWGLWKISFSCTRML